MVDAVSEFIIPSKIMLGGVCKMQLWNISMVNWHKPLATKLNCDENSQETGNLLCSMVFASPPRRAAGKSPCQDPGSNSSCLCGLPLGRRNGVQLDFQGKCRGGGSGWLRAPHLLGTAFRPIGREGAKPCLHKGSDSRRWCGGLESCLMIGLPLQLACAKLV